LRLMLLLITMKYTSTRTLALIITTVILGLVANRTASADSYGPYHPYAYGHNGYWDNQHRYHHWDQYQNHNGYWYHRSDGVRIFINI